MSQEARRNAVALAIAAVVLAILVAFSFRLAAVLPVTDHAVADSLELATDALNSDCLHAQDGFRCNLRIGDSSGSRTRIMQVHMDWDGCWQAIEAAPPRQPTRAAGCVHIWNYVG